MGVGVSGLPVRRYCCADRGRREAAEGVRWLGLLTVQLEWLLLVTSGG